MSTNVTRLLAEATEVFRSDERLDLILSRIPAMVSETDWRQEGDFHEWVELAYGQPGDLEKSPCLVFCRLADGLGAIASEDYKYI